MKRTLIRTSLALLLVPAAMMSTTLGAASGQCARDRAGGQAARHGLHRRSHLGRGPRPDQGRDDDGDHRHRGHRAEGPAHGRRRAQVRHGVRPPTRSRARIGKTLVAPVVTYVPEGSWENIGGHMAQARHDHAARRSLRRAARQRRPQPQGRRLQDDPVPRRVGRQPHRHAHGGRAAERAVEGRARRAYWIDDYYTKAHADQNT